jgi:phenylpropionate dioxygenase-like ring-hydroxylating dioxygenase large terminal subunit
MSQSRFPFTSSPKGWFAVALSRELEAGQVLPVKAFERDLVLFRGEDGKPALLGAFCPHMGAHLGHGGTVVENTIKCPFHAWQFDGTGGCTKIPYADRIPPKAKVRPWAIVERNGMILAWNDIEGSEPEWEVPVIPEIGAEDWTDFEVREWDIRTHSMDMAENQVDVAHFQYLHGTLDYPESEASVDGHIMRVFSKAGMGTKQGNVAGSIESTSYGFGFNTIRFKGIVETLLVTSVTPTDKEHVHVRFCFMVKKSLGAALDKGVGKAFIAEVSRQLEQDIPVWENKAFVHPPMLCEGDGPIPLFRKWLRQFFPAGTFDNINVTAESHNA